jgi:hypothetical protein
LGVFSIPRVTIKTGLTTPDGREELLTEYLCDHPAVPISLPRCWDVRWNSDLPPSFATSTHLNPGPNNRSPKKSIHSFASRSQKTSLRKQAFREPTY